MSVGQVPAMYGLEFAPSIGEANQVCRDGRVRFQSDLLEVLEDHRRWGHSDGGSRQPQGLEGALPSCDDQWAECGSV